MIRAWSTLYIFCYSDRHAYNYVCTSVSLGRIPALLQGVYRVLPLRVPVAGVYDKKPFIRLTP